MAIIAVQLYDEIKMQTKKLIISLIIILFISGCGFGSEEGPIRVKDAYRGTDGLIMNFLENVPAGDVFEDSSFRIYVELMNEGAFDISGGYLTLGLEEDYMSVDGDWSNLEPSRIDVLDENHVMFYLDGKSPQSPLGEEDVITIMVNALKFKEEQSEIHASNIFMTACYDYQTTAGPSVCIDTDIHGSLSIEKPCRVRDISLTSQGAPLAVTKVEVKMLPEDIRIKPHFLIYIENKGNGEVVRKDRVEQTCYSGSLDYSDINVAEVTAFLSDKQLDCEPKIDNTDLKSTVKLKGKEAIVRCFTKDEDAIGKEKGTYTAPLKIIVNYGYTFTISKGVTIRKVLTY